MSVIHSEGRARRPVSDVPVSDVPGSMMVLAMLVGAGTGLGSIAFRWCIQTFTRLFSGHDDYAAAPG
ncbi:chloride channel protein, partial [Streptomyces sp. NPDC048110]